MIRCPPFPRKWTSWWVFSLFFLSLWRVGSSSRERLHLHTSQSQNSPPPAETTQHPPAQRQQGTSSYNLSPRELFCFIISQTCYFVFSSKETHDVLGKDIYILKAFPLTAFSSFFFVIFFLPFTFWRSLINNSELHTERTCTAQLCTQTGAKGAISTKRESRIIWALLHTARKAARAQQ